MGIPGTHDSLARDCGDIAQCQSWTLKQQLSAGIRFFDVRNKHDCDSFPIFHGIIDVHVDFKEVVEEIEAFLHAHPREAIFMRVKREGQCGQHSCSFSDLVHKHCDHSGMWNV